MKLLFKLLLIVIASVGAIGYHSRAPLGETNSRPKAWVPRLAQAQALMPVAQSAPESHASVYLATVPVGAENGLVISPAPNLLLGGDAAPEMVEASIVPAGPSGHRRVVSTPSSDERVRGATAVAIPAAYSVRVPALAGGAADALQDPTPSEPSGWTLLLSSFVVVGFIARRRSRLVAG